MCAPKIYLKKILTRAYLCKQKECQAHGGSSPSAVIGRGHAKEGGIPGVIGQNLLSVINVGETSKGGDWRCDVTAGRLGPSRLMHLSHRGDVTSRLQIFTTETLTTFGTHFTHFMRFEYQTRVFILTSKNSWYFFFFYLKVHFLCVRGWNLFYNLVDVLSDHLLHVYSRICHRLPSGTYFSYVN